MANIVEFLEEIGLENLSCQTLHTCMSGAQLRRSGETEVRFITRAMTPDDIVGDISKTAFIVWMDADKYNAALTKLNGE